MEYLSWIMKYNGDNNEFSFHPRCAPFGINHLCFVDDLMLLCKGDCKSVTLMMRGLKTFSMASGLSTNIDKSAIYFGNVKEHILGITGFQEGNSPFKYLGIPIISKRFSAGDCEALVDKILRRIRCWGTRNLSYAARGGKDQADKVPLVAWDLVCKSKSQGALNVRNIKIWNLAAMGKYVWQVTMKEDSLWVKWIHGVYIHAPPYKGLTHNLERIYRNKKISSFRRTVAGASITTLAYHVWLIPNEALWSKLRVVLSSKSY